MLYYKYSDYLKRKYGDKVYKLPVNLPISCPNRADGYGCTFCADIGTGFEAQCSQLDVVTQLQNNKEHISKRYHAKYYIAYFQNYTNTYMPLEQFKEYINQVLYVDDIVEISISTRPDCVRDDYLSFLNDFSNKHHIHINIELGLQTVNYHTLEKVHRGHGLAEFIDCVLMIKKYDFTICTHMILNLPDDEMTDIIEGAKILSVLPVDIVKLHSLYIAKNSLMAKDYINHQLNICTKEEYLQRVRCFLEYLRPDLAVERLFSRIPQEDALFSNWSTSWWKLNDEFEALMLENESYQGKKYNYTNGVRITF